MISLYSADTDLGTRQVLQDCDGPVQFAFESPDHADHLSMERIIPVAEVEPRNVHAGLDELFENLFRGASGPDSANDFGPAHLL
jgi:hypothetical protein